MGQVRVEGLGTVQIEGDTPTPEEAKRILAAQRSIATRRDPGAPLVQPEQTRQDVLSELIGEPVAPGELNFPGLRSELALRPSLESVGERAGVLERGARDPRGAPGDPLQQFESRVAQDPTDPEGVRQILLGRLAGTDDPFQELESAQTTRSDIAELLADTGRAAPAFAFGLGAEALLARAGISGLLRVLGVAGTEGVAEGVDRLGRAALDPLEASPQSQNIQEAIDVGSAGALFGAAGFVVSPVARVLRNAGFEAADAARLRTLQRETADLGLPGFSLAGETPLGNSILMQSAGTSQLVRGRLTQRLARGADVVNRLSREVGPTEAIPTRDLTRLADDVQKRLLNVTPDLSLAQGMPRRTAHALASAVREWERLRAGLEERLYAKVTGLARGQQVRFDITPAIDEARRIQNGVLAQAGAGTRQIGPPLPPKAQRLITNILEIDPLLTPGTADAFTQVRNLRTQAFQLAEDVENAQIHGELTRLGRSLTEVMEAPIGGDREFQRALRAANAAKRSTETARTQLGTGVLLGPRTDPDDIGRVLLTPENPARLRQVFEVLKATGREAQLPMVKRGFATKLMESPRTLGKVLDSMEKDGTRALLFTDTQAQALRQNARSLRRLSDSAEVIQQSRTQTELADNLTQIATRGGQRLKGLAEFVEQAGGPETPIGRTSRAAVFQSILDQAAERTAGQTTLQAPAARAAIKRLQAAGIDRLLTRDDLRKLELLDDWLSIQKSMGVGESLQAAEIAADISRVSNIATPGRLGRAGATLLSKAGAGRLLLAESAEIRALGGLIKGGGGLATGPAMLAYANILETQANRFVEDAETEIDLRVSIPQPITDLLERGRNLGREQFEAVRGLPERLGREFGRGAAESIRTRDLDPAER